MKLVVHDRLKICCPISGVRVQVPPPVQMPVYANWQRGNTQDIVVGDSSSSTGTNKRKQIYEET